MTSLLTFAMALQDIPATAQRAGEPHPMSFADMGFMRWPITFCLLMVLVLALRAVWRIRSGGPDRKASARAAVDGSLFWGAYAAVLGVLGTVIGIMVAAQSIEAFGRADPPLVWGGVKIALSTTVYGLLVFLVAALAWWALRAWHRRAVLGAA